MRTKKEPRNGEFLSPFRVIIGVLTCSRFERREQLVLAFGEKRTQCPDYFDLCSLPRRTPATPSFTPLRGKRPIRWHHPIISQKSCLFSQKQAGISSRPRRFCVRFFWGWHGECKTWGWERVRGEFTGESLDFRDFSAIVLTIPMPPKEKK